MASVVEVTFIDGEVKEYQMDASITVAGFLSRKMAETGFLSIWNKEESYVIPSNQIRSFTIRRKQED